MLCNRILRLAGVVAVCVGALPSATQGQSKVWPEYVETVTTGCLHSEDVLRILETQKQQGEIVAGVLSSSLRSEGRCDFGPVKGKFVRMLKAFPGLENQGGPYIGYALEILVDGEPFYIVSAERTIRI